MPESSPSRALLVVDVQNDFTEGGALGVGGGHAVAAGITELLRGPSRSSYALVIASRDWHDAEGLNGGHFAAPGTEPDFVGTWPVHCVAGTFGAAYDDLFDSSAVDVHVRKGMGAPAYSMFEGVTSSGSTVAAVLASAGITSVDVVGIATDYCVRATALDAVAALDGAGGFAGVAGVAGGGGGGAGGGLGAGAAGGGLGAGGAVAGAGAGNVGAGAGGAGAGAGGAGAGAGGAGAGAGAGGGAVRAGAGAGAGGATEAGGAADAGGGAAGGPGARSAARGVPVVRVLASLVAGVAATSSAAALDELRAAGVEVVPASA